MEMQREKTLVSVDRLSEFPESVLTYILSLLSESGRKQVVRCSVLSRQWRFLWMSVPVSLTFFYLNPNSPMEILNMIASIHRELYYWRSCKKIRKFEVYYHWYEECQVKDVDLWVHFATKVAHVEDFALGLGTNLSLKYEFPQFAYENTSLRNLILVDCQLNPSGSFNRSNLVSLKFCDMNLTDALMEKFLSILELRGWQSPPSSRKCLEFAGALELSHFPGICSFLQSSSDLERLVIDWFLLEPRDLLLKYTNEDEQTRRFETRNFNCSLLHLKTTKIKNYDEPPSENNFVLQLVRFLLKNATVLEKLVIAALFEGSDDVSWDYVTLTQELLSFPRSSPHASIAFSYL